MTVQTGITEDANALEEEIHYEHLKFLENMPRILAPWEREDVVVPEQIAPPVSKPQRRRRKSQKLPNTQGEENLGDSTTAPRPTKRARKNDS